MERLIAVAEGRCLQCLFGGVCDEAWILLFCILAAVRKLLDVEREKLLHRVLLRRKYGPSAGDEMDVN